MGVITWRWWRGEELGGRWRRWEVGALRRWGREVATRLLCLAYLGLQCQGQVSQIELSWFWGSRRSI